MQVATVASAQEDRNAADKELAIIKQQLNLMIRQEEDAAEVRVTGKVSKKKPALGTFVGRCASASTLGPNDVTQVQTQRSIGANWLLSKLTMQISKTMSAVTLR